MTCTAQPRVCSRWRDRPFPPAATQQHTDSSSFQKCADPPSELDLGPPALQLPMPQAQTTGLPEGHPLWREARWNTVWMPNFLHLVTWRAGMLRRPSGGSSSISGRAQTVRGAVTSCTFRLLDCMHASTFKQTSMCLVNLVKATFLWHCFQ